LPKVTIPCGFEPSPALLLVHAHISCSRGSHGLSENRQTSLIESDPSIIMIESDPSNILIKYDPSIILTESDPSIILIESDPSIILIESDPSNICLTCCSLTPTSAAFQNASSHKQAGSVPSLLFCPLGASLSTPGQQRVGRQHPAHLVPHINTRTATGWKTASCPLGASLQHQDSNGLEDSRGNLVLVTAYRRGFITRS